MQPDNILLGDTTGIDLPEAAPDETALNELKHKAKYTRSKEYKDLKAKADLIIEKYQKFLPGNVEPELIPEQERAKYWAVASIVIKEINGLFSEHEGAQEELEDVSTTK